MANLRIILHDQLTHDISSLYDINKDKDVVLMVELYSEFTYVKHHKKKIVFLLSAMRHFAAELVDSNIKVRYVKLDDSNNKDSLKEEVQEIIKERSVKKIIITRPSEYRILQEIKPWKRFLGIPVQILEDDRFLCTPSEFRQWVGNKKQLRMEFFYREMRKKYNILINNNEPEGGKWNFDNGLNYTNGVNRPSDS